MQLRDYLHVKRIKSKDFAEKVGATQGQVSSWASGRYTPSAKWIAKIQQATDYEVILEDWLRVQKTGG